MLGIKEGLVECATVCVKSVVILRDVYGLGSDGAFDLHDSPSDNALSETFNTWVTAIRMDSTTVPSLARV